MIGGMFATTRWSLVAAAADPADPQTRAALAALCTAYWYPVYGYVRRRGHDHHAAQDLTQAFFARLLEKNDLAAADQTRGRFRAFLLAACRHFLLNEHDKESARKRGGGRHRLSLDFGDADGRFTREPASDETPERAFDREWALGLLDRAVGELRREYEESGRAKLFAALKDTLLGGGDVAYADLAGQLGMTEGAVKVAVHRLRQRYRDRLRSAIADTVASPDEVDDEVRDLFAALG
ncbi:MAG: sigma-70 family RNA polymerase sigma factor [Gemmataceae bacterium]|nr:sigma-70 family RNA polymerase sigma factor [Gemmataceae bacterium]